VGVRPRLRRHAHLRPFDDWWHNAYGLDVRIVSPPHILLGLGMMGIVLGALLRTLALQNASEGANVAARRVLFAVASGSSCPISRSSSSRQLVAPDALGALLSHALARARRCFSSPSPSRDVKRGPRPPRRCVHDA
jgi:hypothetical protein